MLNDKQIKNKMAEAFNDAQKETGGAFDWNFKRGFFCYSTFTVINTVEMKVRLKDIKKAYTAAKEKDPEKQDAELFRGLCWSLLNHLTDHALKMVAEIKTKANGAEGGKNEQY